MPAVPTFAQSDDPAVASTLAVVQAQKSFLLGLGGLVARWAWAWFMKVLGGFIVSWVIDAVVIAIAGWTLVQLVEWLKARLTKVSPVVSGTSVKAEPPAPQYTAYADPDFPGVWHVIRLDRGVVEATFPDGEAKAKAYAAILNTGIPLC